MAQTKKLHKELLNTFITLFQIDGKEFNWGFQTKILNSLLSQYSAEEIEYALNYYANQGVNVYSLGFLKFGSNMEKPVSLFHVEKNVQKEGSGERNRKRMELNSKTKRRTDAPEYLFTGTE